MINRRNLIKSSAAGVCSIAYWPHIGLGQTNSSGKKIRIGQIGTKHPHASGKLASICKLDDIFDVVGVVEPDDTRWEQVKSTGAYKDIERVSETRLLDDSSVSAVAVEVGVKDLVPTAMRCIQAGKHIHLDKPAGESMAACRELHSAANKRDLTIQMGYMLRYNPAFEFLFQAVRDGWLGEITELSAAMGKKAADGTRNALAEFQGGGMFELACHVIDAMVTVLGKPLQVTAHNRINHPDKDQFIDNQLAVFDYPKALATVRCNHIDPFGFPRRYFEVVGEQGSIRINPLEPPKIMLSLDRAQGPYKKGAHEVTLRKSTGRYDDEFRDLAKVIRGEKKLAWDSAHDLIVHECVLRASGVKI